MTPELSKRIEELAEKYFGEELWAIERANEALRSLVPHVRQEDDDFITERIAGFRREANEQGLHGHYNLIQKWFGWESLASAIEQRINELEEK